MRPVSALFCERRLDKLGKIKLGFLGLVICKALGSATEGEKQGKKLGGRS